MTSEVDTLIVNGPPADPNKIYELHAGLNLISFSTSGSVSISDGIEDSIENEIPFVIGESKAAAQIGGQWVGSLIEFEGGRGYWINSNIDLDFQYNLNNLSLSRQKNIITDNNDFAFNQSQYQSFYFMTLEGLRDINTGDWIIAYNEDVIVGAREWNGGIIDIPVMGHDGSENTTGYCNTGDFPQFKVYSLSNDCFSDISADNITSFSPNSISYIEDMNSEISESIIPDSYNIISIYPNPFNPVTKIEFSIPEDSQVSIVVYNLYGEEVHVLTNKEYQVGYHYITWDASQYSSGIYFLNMSSRDYNTTQKLILVK